MGSSALVVVAEATGRDVEDEDEDEDKDAAVAVAVAVAVGVAAAVDAVGVDGVDAPRTQCDDILGGGSA